MHQNKSAAYGISGTTIKMIAIIAMALDHFGAAVIENGYFRGMDPDMMAQLLSTQGGQIWRIMDMCLRTVGRVAFPLFCFLLVEGFLHTRDARRYLLNLTAFAFISEIPFDIAVFGSILEFSHQNVYFTLALGLFTVMGLKRYEGRALLQTLIVFLGCGAAMLLRTDYSMIGILMIAFFYLLRNDRKYRLFVVGGIAFVESIWYFGIAALAMIPVHLYNGERGKVRNKYFFYLFYPVHLLLFAGIRICFF